MLEEALRNELHNPSETAAAMLNFIQFELPAGGVAAEVRFLKNLFGPLCDRIFGELLGAQDHYRHKDGGWLSTPTRWSRGSTNSSMSSSGAPASALPAEPIGQQIAAKAGLLSTKQPWESDPVVELLGTRDYLYRRASRMVGLTSSSSSFSKHVSSQQQLPPTLMETMSSSSNEMESRPNFSFSFPFHALPEAMQESWLALLTVSRGAVPLSDVPVSDNAVQLLTVVLRKRPDEQRDLIVYYHHHHHKMALQRDPRTNIAAVPLRHSPPRSSFVTSPLQAKPNPFAFSTNHPPQPTLSSLGNEEEATPQVALDLLEYYLVLFLRYPLAAPTKKPSETTPRNRVVHSLSSKEPFGETIYRYLFECYLHHFLPYEDEQRDDMSSSSRSIDWDRSRTTTTTRGGGSSELFFRLILALWLESQHVVLTTDNVLELIQERRARAGWRDPATAAATPPAAPSALTFDLSASYDLVQAKYTPPPRLISQCLGTLIEHLILDPQVASLVCTNATPTLGGGGTDASRRWCLTTAMTALQQPLFNYLRITFRHASLHATNSPFYTALDAWLLWLEPWNHPPASGTSALKEYISS